MTRLICSVSKSLFVRNAECSLDKIFSMYSDNIQVVSTSNLRSVISDIRMTLGLSYMNE